MDVSALEGAELDYWVAKAEGIAFVTRRVGTDIVPATEHEFDPEGPADEYDHSSIWKMWRYLRYSADWAQGGPIIEREIIDIECIMSHIDGDAKHVGTVWLATTKGFDPRGGPTPLIAAMRAYVASKYGPTVPDEPVA